MAKRSRGTSWLRTVNLRNCRFRPESNVAPGWRLGFCRQRIPTRSLSRWEECRSEPRSVVPSGVATVSTSFGRLSRLKFVKEKDRRPQRPTILPGRHTIALLLRVTVIKSPTLLLLFLACALSPAVAQHQH